ncbi:MAG: L-2-amino-thiazoline-4-carboxylic acid hydrolase [Clostridia bacterium]|nr:L-2-amino-thiazoline-4-carboxylic acid hydrolase [Clostridia bacterium]
MKYIGMPMGMWLLFRKSFRDQLVSVLKHSKGEADRITGTAGDRYRKIIAGLPAFEKQDRCKMNIVSCAMFSAFLLSVRGKPSLEEATEYYAKAMMIRPMRWFCRMGGRRKFSEQDIAGMKATAVLKAADRNPYSWNMEFLPYPDGNGYEARFDRCGICVLMKELGLKEYVPAMCRLDYTMAEAGGVSDFIRQYTLASGGPYCDCGYRKKAVQ